LSVENGSIECPDNSSTYPHNKHWVVWGARSLENARWAREATGTTYNWRTPTHIRFAGSL